MRTLVVLCAALFLAGCGSERAEVARLDAHRYLGAPVHAGNLTVWPIFTDEPKEIGEFVTMQEAQTKGAVEVREKGDGGEVSSLVIENKGDVPMLVVAGTVVKGGKQDRQIAQDLIVAAKSTVPVDTFCVEAGRWDVVRLNHVTAGKFDVLDTYATVGIRNARFGDQREVWNEVAKARAQVKSVARAASLKTESSGVDVLEAKVEDGDKVAAEVHGLFEKHADAIGFAYAINGEPVTVRTFAHKKLLQSHLDAFVRTMCLEAALAKGGGAGRRATAGDVIELVKGIDKAEQELLETAAANKNGIRQAAAGFNAVCYFDKVAVSEDWTARKKK